jgi:hypothetical protein
MLGQPEDSGESNEMKTKVLNLVMLCVLVEGAVAVEPITLKLWPDGPPTVMAPKSDATVKLIQSYGGVGPNRISDVSDPTITVFRPEKPNGTSVIVAPGGGFMFLSYAHEGTQVCEWLNSLGITAVLLKYRTPTRDEKEMFELPVQDAERALGLVRHHATEWKLDPKRVGLLGFSAGANLAGHVSWDRGSRTYPQVPELDDPRGPDFLVFIYGGGFLDEDDKSKFRTGFSIPADAPPVFMLVAQDAKSTATHIIVERIVNDIDEIVKKVRFPDWQHTTAGERLVQKELRRTLLRYKLHTDQELFDKAYGYIVQYY